MPKTAPKKGWLAVLGPGQIIGASDDDPSGIATYSQAGAQFGFSMCRVMLFTFPLMAAIQEIGARIGRVTWQGIAGNIREYYSQWLLRAIVGLLLVANIIDLGADLGAMGEALALLIHGPVGLYVVGFAVGCVLLEVFVSYERYVAILKWSCLTLFAYVATALAVDVPWGTVAYNTFIPDFSFKTDYVVAIVAVLGTAITPYCFFWQSSQEAQDERIDPLAHTPIEAPPVAKVQIGRMRIDTYVGMGYSSLISFFIIVTTAATLNAHGITDIQTSSQAAEALRPIAGIFTFAVSTLIGIGIDFVGMDPIEALFWAAVINGVVSVPLTIVMMVMAMAPKVMGDFVLPRALWVMGWLCTATMTVAVGIMFWAWCLPKHRSGHAAPPVAVNKVQR